MRRFGLGREVGRGVRGRFFFFSCSRSFFFFVISEMDFVTGGLSGAAVDSA